MYTMHLVGLVDVIKSIMTHVMEFFKPIISALFTQMTTLHPGKCIRFIDV